ncbi:MAG: hypothetical protein IT318_24770 [Anaerolineales bacterium]|nr:hypothetical protein [Anaerolineales bacterium]
MGDFALGEALLGTGIDLSGLNKGLDEAKGAAGAGGDAIGGVLQTALGTALGVVGGQILSAIGGGLLDLAGKVGSFFTDSFTGALDAEQNMARFDAVLRATTVSAEEQAAAYAEAAGQQVTYAALSAEALDDLQDKYAVAAEKLAKLEQAYADTAEPTAAQTVALKNQREAVAELAAQIEAGSATITTTMADKLGLVAPVARLTRDELLALADQYKDLAGGSDDAVIAAESVLLKFQTIGRETFPDALGAATDLAAFLGTDVATAAQTLGFALDNPGESLMRLNKQTGAFTDAEIEQIQAMVDAGDAAGAQQMILDQLAQTIGGAAAAQAGTLAGKMDILKERFADVGEGVMSVLIPPLSTLVDNVLMPLLPVAEEVGEQVGYIFEALISGDTSGALEAAYEGFDILANAFPGLNEQIHFAQQVFADISAWLGTNIPVAIDTLVGFWNGTLLPALQTAWAWAQAELLPFLSALADVYLKGIQDSAAQLGTAWTTQLLPDLQAAWTWAQANLLPLLSDLWDWLKVFIPEAIQAEVDFWNNVLLPALITFSNWYRDNLGPLLASLWDWLKVNLPLAIQALSDFWTGTLQPAITSVWAWVTGTLLPTLSDLWTWLSATLTAALQSLSDYWTGTLQPAIEGVWSWLDGTLFPFVESLIDLLDAVFGRALEVLASYWTDTLLPAITDVWTFLNDKVFPIFQDIAEYLGQTFGPAFTTLGTVVDGLLDGAFKLLQGAIDSISQGIQNLTTFFGTLADAIRGLPSPPPLYTPGSPTPFELGLLGIADAIGTISDSLPGLDAGLQLSAGPLQMLTAGGAGPTTNNTTIVNAAYRYQPEKRLTDDMRRLRLMHTRA